MERCCWATLVCCLAQRQTQTCDLTSDLMCSAHHCHSLSMLLCCRLCGRPSLRSRAWQHCVAVHSAADQYIASILLQRQNAELGSGRQAAACVAGKAELQALNWAVLRVVHWAHLCATLLSPCITISLVLCCSHCLIKGMEPSWTAARHSHTCPARCSRLLQQASFCPLQPSVLPVVIMRCLANSRS